MKELTILSGKGGTGKTSLAAALASVAGNAVFCDSDVDAPDLHLIFKPEIRESYIFEGSYIASINPDICTNCGLCIEQCRFGAIHEGENGLLKINPFQCEGCRLCERICPAEAITSEKSTNNEWFVSKTRFGMLVHARMGPGEENSGRLVTQVRKKAREIATGLNAGFIINDGPPGIGCPVIASLTGTDVVLLIIEPTYSGLHDAKRLFELVQSFRIPMLAIINKYDINQQVTEEVEAFLRQNHIPLLAKLHFTKKMVESMVVGETIVEFSPDDAISNGIRSAWQSIKMHCNAIQDQV